MSKNIWMKKQTEILQNGKWCQSPNQAVEEQQITAETFERITSQKADTYFNSGNEMVVELVSMLPSRDQRAIYHFNYIS